MSQTGRVTPDEQEAAIMDEIASLARTASVEINVQDRPHLEESRSFLAPGTKLYVSHLPGQTWEATQGMCEAVRRTGFVPVPHIPVRLVHSVEEFERLLDGLIRIAGVDEVLLVAGDYPRAAGPFGSVAQALGSRILSRYGLTRVSVAGHPEGHPKVATEEIRLAELTKARMAADEGMAATFVTQFLFEPEPFLEWAKGLRSQGVTARLICGLAGPARISTLLRYAIRCGVGPSIRALGTHTTALTHLLGDHGPDRMLRHLAAARLHAHSQVDGVHMFGFGGYLRTVKWLARVRAGQFRLKATGGFDA